MSQLVNRVKKFLGKEEEGATMVEYGIMVALIAIVCIVAVTLVGTNVRDIFNSIAATLGAAV